LQITADRAIQLDRSYQRDIDELDKLGFPLFLAATTSNWVLSPDWQAPAFSPGTLALVDLVDRFLEYVDIQPDNQSIKGRAQVTR